jgi:hypothetical protein
VRWVVPLLFVAGCGGEAGDRGAAAALGDSGAGDTGTVIPGTVIGPENGQVTIVTTPRTVAPGEEAFLCQDFANPFGETVGVVRSHSTMTSSHHMFVFFDPIGGNGSLEDCSGLEYTKTLHASQTSDSVTSYPPGVGVQVTLGTGLRVLAHYLNTTDEPVEAKVTVTFDFVPLDQIELHAGPLFFNNFSISVPPNGVGQASETCEVPNDIQITEVVSHMHKQGVHFVAKTDTGQLLYEGSDWDEPTPAKFDPPLALPKGTKITYTCDYENPTSQWLDFGESASTNEMCILSGTYYPAILGKAFLCF